MKTIIKNGKVYTIDKDWTIAEAVVVEDGIITFVGSNEDADRFLSQSVDADKDQAVAASESQSAGEGQSAGDEVTVIDAAGNTVLPGFIEPHVHMPGNAYIALYNIDLFDAKTEEETMETIRKFVEAHPDRESYTGRGFMSSVFPGVESSFGPRKERLDEICPDKPMVFTDFGGHVFWLNSAALREYNITVETPDVPGGINEKDPETGELWGTLKDEAKVLFPVPEYTFEEHVESVKWFQDFMSAYGYTAVFTNRPASNPNPNPLYDVFRSIADEGQLNLRIVGAREIKSIFEPFAQIEEAAEQMKRYPDGQVRARTAKYFIDGTIEASSGYLLEPYLPPAGREPGFCGSSLWETETLKEAFVKTLEAGLNIHIHAIGDAAVQQSIDALEYAQKLVPGDHRNTITQLQLVEPEDIRRMGELGIIACVNVHWHFKDPSIFFEAELPFLGEERANREYPLKSFLDAGVVITSSGDVPITPYPNPFYAIQLGVTRNLVNAEYFQVEPITDIDDPKWLLGPEERVTVEDMVKAYTVNAAYANYLEDEVGSIEVGKYGDLIIIDQDFFEIDPLDIEQTQVLKTIFGGKVVYSCVKRDGSF